MQQRGSWSWMSVVIVLILAVRGPGGAAAAKEPEGPRIEELKRMTAEAVRLRREGKLKEAIVVWKRRLAVVRDIVGSEYKESVAGSLEMLAEMQEADGDTTAALKTLRHVHEVRAKLNGADHWRATDARLAVGRLDRLRSLRADDRERLRNADKESARAFAVAKEKRFAGAVEIERRALEVRREVLGAEDRAIGDSLYRLGYFARRSGDLAAARRWDEEGVAVRQKVLGVHPETAQSLQSLGIVCDLLHDTRAALQAEERALSQFTRTMGEADPASLVMLESVASTRGILGDAGGAVEARRRQLRILQKAHGEASPEAAGALLSLGRAENGLDFTAGRRSLELALELYDKAPGRNAPLRIACLENLALSHRGLGNLARADEMTEEAYQLSRKTAGEDHPSTLRLAVSAARNQALRGDAKAARRRLETALEALERARDTGDDLVRRPGIERDLAHAGEVLGEVLHQLGELGPARERLVVARAAFRRLGAAAKYEAAFSDTELARIDAALGNWDEVTKEMTTARRAVRAYVLENLWGLAEDEQLRYLQLSDRSMRSSALSLGLAGRHRRGMAGASAEWLLNGKGIALEVLSQQYTAVEGEGEGGSDLLGRWRAVRAELARRAYETPTDADRHRTELAELAGKERDLAAQVGRSGGRVARPSPWRSLAEVAGALPRGAVLVEFARFPYWNHEAADGRGRWQGDRYAAWVIAAGDPPEVRIVDLGETGPIDAAIDAVSRAMAEAPKRIDAVGEVDAEKEARPKLEALAALVLKPLLDHLKDHDEWLLSPDGKLWLVPWAALPLDGATYTAEKHIVHLLVSGRSLTDGEPFTGRRSAPLVLADPDFDDGDATTPPAAPPDVGKRPDVLRLPQAQRLPGTALEARAIAPALKRLTGEEPRVLLRSKAREEAVHAARHPRILVLSTHGFFLDGPEYRPTPGSGLLEERTAPGRPVESPLLRSGLLLAGCNRRDPPCLGGADGVLTALEIVGLDLRGCDLVVLSACETGLGEVRSGEGVAGLRQAFELAGARAVAATLWQIPDQESVQLLDRFAGNLADGRAPAAALAKAQAAVIEKRRKRGAAAHPFVWAAFTVTGR